MPWHLLTVGSWLGVNLSVVASRFRCLARLGSCLVLLCAPSALMAQSYDNPSIGQQPISAYPQDYKPLGVRAGSFLLQPGVELAGEWVDNVLYSFDNEQSDFVWHIRPYLTAQSNWSRHSLNIRLAADIGRHDDFSIRDYEDYFLSINGDIDVKTRSTFDYRADYMQLHEDLNDRSSEQGVEPTVYTLTGLGLGYQHTFNRLSVDLDYDHRDLDFDNALRADGSILDNQDRDRAEDAIGMRFNYAFKADMQAFVGATWRSIDFDEDIDRNGYMRSSEGYTIDAGISLGLTGVLDGDLFISYHDRDFDDPTLGTIDGWAAGAGLTWYPTRLTTVHGSISSGIEETTSADSSGYLGTLYQVRVDHELRRNVQINGRLTYRDNDYTLLPGAASDARESDHVFGAGLGGTWFINRHMWLSASYDISELSSNVPSDDYKVNRVWLVLGFEK